MFRERVSSRSIAALGYDADRNLLEVEFVSGRVYRYCRVDEDTYEAFRAAPSKGRFFNARIKDAYPWEQIR